MAGVPVSSGHAAPAVVDGSSSSGDVGAPVPLTGVSGSSEDAHPPSRTVSTSSADASLRMSTWFRERMGGELTGARRLVYVREILLMRHDALWAAAPDLSRCLNLVGIHHIKLGRPGCALRYDVIAALELERDRLEAMRERSQEQQVDAVAGSDAVSDDSDVIPVDEDDGREAASPPSAPPLQHRASERPRRQSSVVRPPADFAEAVGEADMALIELLLSGVAPPSVEQSLSPPGLKAFRLLRRAQQQSSSSSSSVPVSLPPVPVAPASVVPRQAAVPVASDARPASSSARHADIVHALPVVNTSRSVPRSSASVPLPRPSSVLFPRQVVFDGGDHSSDSEGDQEAVSHSSTDSGLPHAISSALVSMGVIEELASDNALLQTAAMVSPSSYQLYWSSHLGSIGDKKLFYEGNVLSLLLDAGSAGNLPLLLEVAARRWLSLYLVAAGMDWSSAQAWLPMARADGVTARQMHLMGRFAKANALPSHRAAAYSASTSDTYRGSSSRRGRASSRSPARSRSNSRGRGSGTSGSGSNSGTGSVPGASSSRKGKSNGKHRKGSGAGGNRSSDVPSAAQS